LQGYSEEAQGVVKKAASVAGTGAGLAIAGVSAAYGNSAGVKAGMAVVRRGVGGALKQGVGTGLEAVANHRSKSREESKQKREEQKQRRDYDKGYEDRKEGLSEEDANFADQMRRDYGADVTTAEGREKLEQLNPELAKRHQQELYRIRDNTMANAMARRMPSNIPAKGTPEYQALTQQFGEENVEAWRAAQVAEQAKVDKAMDNYKKLSRKDQAMTPKPKLKTANVRGRFEAIQSADRVKLETEMNRLAQQAANSLSTVMDLQNIDVDNSGILTKFNQTMKVNFPSKKPSDAQLTLAQSKIQDAVRKAGQQLGNIQGTLDLKIDMPNASGSGSETWDVRLEGLNQNQQQLKQKFDDSILAMKVNEILEQRKGSAVSIDEVRKTFNEMQQELTKGLAGSAKAPTVFESITGKAGLDMNQTIDMLGPMLGIDFRDLYTYKDRMEKISKRLRDVEKKQNQKPPKTPPPSGNNP
jgi:hypothetical protein